MRHLCTSRWASDLLYYIILICVDSASVRVMASRCRAGSDRPGREWPHWQRVYISCRTNVRTVHQSNVAYRVIGRLLLLTDCCRLVEEQHCSGHASGSTGLKSGHDRRELDTSVDHLQLAHTVLRAVAAYFCRVHRERALHALLMLQLALHDPAPTARCDTFHSAGLLMADARHG